MYVAPIDTPEIRLKKDLPECEKMAEQIVPYGTNEAEKQKKLEEEWIKQKDAETNTDEEIRQEHEEMLKLQDQTVTALEDELDAENKPEPDDMQEYEQPMYSGVQKISNTLFQSRHWSIDSCRMKVCDRQKQLITKL